MLPPKLAMALAGRLVRRDDWSYDEDWGNWDNEEKKDCIDVEPGPNGHVPLYACTSYYNYDPQFAPAVATAVIFGIFTAIHIFEAAIYKKRYAWVLIMGALWETLGFIIHSLGAKDQQQIGYATAWTILFLLAPLWINAFVYMTLARMVLFWHPEGKIWIFKASAIGKLFVIADIICFIVQGVGGILANPSASPEIIKIGIDIYIAGMSIQQFCIVVFLVLMYAFQRRCAEAEATGQDLKRRTSWRPLLYAQYAVLVFITVRIIFRLIEFAKGIDPATNPIPFHEEYTYALDCFPMMIALLILAIWHPGRFLIGPESQFPSRKEKKAMKLAEKEEKAAMKQAKKDAKRHKHHRGSTSHSEDDLP